MTGYKPLGGIAFEAALRPSLEAENISEVALSNGADTNHLFNEVSYYRENNTIVVLNPFDNSRYADLITSLERGGVGDLDSCHLLLGLKGDGVTEGHIVTAYLPPVTKGKERRLQIFDPKTSDAHKFFHQPTGNRIATVILGLFRALIPRYSTQINAGDLPPIDYHALGTQSFFDPASCGYHTASNILTLKDMISSGTTIDRDSLLQASRSPVARSINSLRSKHSSSVDSGFGSFLKKAWQDTYMPLENEAEREKLHFGHYFMGWPKEKGAGQKVLYFATLGFLFNPLLNLIKLPTEFLLNALSETASYLKNALIATAPKNPLAQYLRSGALLAMNILQYLFKGISLLVRTVTSPVSSFKAAKKTGGWPLALLSATFSVAAYAALAIFAAPAVMALAGPGAAGVLAPVLKLLATPVTFIATQLGLQVPAVIGAAITAIAGSSLLIGAKALLGKAVSFFSKKTATPSGKSPTIEGFVGVKIDSEEEEKKSKPKRVADIEDDFECITNPEGSGTEYSSDEEDKEHSSYKKKNPFSRLLNTREGKTEVESSTPSYVDPLVDATDKKKKSEPQTHKNNFFSTSPVNVKMKEEKSSVTEKKNSL